MARLLAILFLERKLVENGNVTNSLISNSAVVRLGSEKVIGILCNNATEQSVWYIHLLAPIYGFIFGKWMFAVHFDYNCFFEKKVHHLKNAMQAYGARAECDEPSTFDRIPGKFSKVQKKIRTADAIHCRTSAELQMRTVILKETDSNHDFEHHATEKLSWILNPVTWRLKTKNTFQSIDGFFRDKNGEERHGVLFK